MLFMSGLIGINALAVGFFPIEVSRHDIFERDFFPPAADVGRLASIKPTQNCDTPLICVLFCNACTGVAYVFPVLFPVMRPGDPDGPIGLAEVLAFGGYPIVNSLKFLDFLRSCFIRTSLTRRS
jgi:hypothetical protein